MTQREKIVQLDAKSIDDDQSCLLAYRLGSELEFVTTERHGADTTVIVSMDQAWQLVRALTAALHSMQRASSECDVAPVPFGGDDRFKFVMGSDLQRDGMFLECHDRVGARDVLEVFYSDDAHSFTTFWSAGGELPFEMVERFVRVARERLPPAE